MSDIKDSQSPLPEPAFRLNWHDDGARYTVSKPNIGSTDCYTAEQVQEAFELGVAAGQAEMQGEIISRKEGYRMLFDQWQELRAKLKALEEQEPAAWMFPDDLERFKTTEATATSFSVKVGSPDAGTSLPLYTAAGAKS